MKEHMYKVQFDRDEDGWWMVSIPDLQGVRTQAKNIAQGLERIREALAAAEGDDVARKAMLVPIVSRPEIAELLEKLRADRTVVDEMQVRLLERAKRTVDALIKYNVSMRDAASLLEMSHQRVHQIANERPPKKPRARPLEKTK